jgi:multiple antibiotic resistance protein
VDAIGALPLFMGMTEGLKQKRVRRIVLQSVGTALIVALSFLAIGESALRFLGITMSDFMIAGGIILLVIAGTDLVRHEKRTARLDTDSLGVVPVGVPLIAGPAVLATSMLLLREYGFVPTFFAIIVNVLIAGVVFWFSFPINRFLGKAGAKAISKLANLLLASIAIMIVRKGVLLLVDVLQ